MAVNQNRPYERHMVTNLATLLPAGQPLSALAVGQIGIFDARTNLSVVAPTYQTNRVIYIAQGTPDHSMFPEGAGVPNMVRRTHNIDGKKLKRFYAAPANQGLGEIVTLGYDGVDVTKNLTALPGSVFYYWVRLTGEPIFNLNPDRNKGVIIQGAVDMPCIDDCSTGCNTVDCQTIVSKILDDWNGIIDPATGQVVGGKFLPGGQRASQYVKMSPLVHCTPNASFVVTQYSQYCINVPDDGSQAALGIVQAQYPGKGITRTNRVGIISTYCFTQLSSASAPADFNQVEGTVVPNCTTCPAGASFTPALSVFLVHYAGSITGKAAAITSALAAYAPVVTTILQTDPLTGVTSFNVTTKVGTTQAQVNTALAALVGSTLPGYQDTEFVGNTAPYCTLPASTIAWNSPTTNFCESVQVQFTITVEDDACNNTGADILAQLQAAYANIATDYGTVSGSVTITTSGSCANVFTLTTQSKNCVAENCSPDQVQFPIIPDWNGQPWTPVPFATGTQPCVCGVQLASNFIPRLENECTFGYFVRQYDWVHIEISSHNPDWRSTDLCEQDPVATRVQNGVYPNGDGSAVVRYERQDRMYDFDYWYLHPNLREAFDYYFEAKFDAYYDMIGVEYEFEYSSNLGWGQEDRDRYIQYIWMPTTQTGALVTALNTYAASVNVNIEPITL